MSDLTRSSITALRLALARSLEGDTFVIKKTSRWIKNHIENIDSGVPQLHEMLVKYLDNDELFAKELLSVFCSSRSNISSARSSRNLECLRELEVFLAERLKKRPEGLLSE